MMGESKPWFDRLTTFDAGLATRMACHEQGLSIARAASNGCAKRGRGRSIDLIVGVAFPSGRAKMPPSIFSPFQHPECEGGTNATARPKEQILRTIAKVRQWARGLRTGAVSSFSAIAKNEGISIPRVSQLMVLDQLTAAQVETCLSRSMRLSIRALIQYARSCRSGD
jgi:hypothetical protein